MDLNEYLNIDPSRLRVIDLKRAITALGGIPGDRATKAQLIQQFIETRLKYIKKTQGKPQSRPHSESIDTNKFVDAIDEQLAVINQNLGHSRIGRDDLTQSAFEFTGAFNDRDFHAHLARENKSDPGKPVSPLKKMKNPYGVEGTPGERKRVQMADASMNKIDNFRPESPLPDQLPPPRSASKLAGSVSQRVEGSSVYKSTKDLTVSHIDAESARSVLSRSSRVDKDKDKGKLASSKVHSEMKRVPKDADSKHAHKEKNKGKNKHKEGEKERSRSRADRTDSDRRERDSSLRNPAITITAPSNPYPHIKTNRESKVSTAGQSGGIIIASRRGSVGYQHDQRYSADRVAVHEATHAKQPKTPGAKSRHHRAHSETTHKYSHPSHDATKGLFVKVTVFILLSLVGYQVYSLASDPVKPQVPVFSHIISVFLASFFSGPVYKDTLTHTSAQYGLSEECPLFGTCAGGKLISCASGYQKSSFNDFFYPQVSFVSMRNFWNALGNNAMAHWMPSAYKRMTTAFLSDSGSKESDAYGLAQTQYSYGFFTRPPALQRRVRCQRTNTVTKKLSLILQALDTELQRHKGNLFCRSRGRKIVLDTSLPLLKTKTVSSYMRRKSLYFTVVTSTNNDGVLEVDHPKDLVAAQMDILPNDVLEELTNVIIQESTDKEAYLPPNIKFRLPIDVSDLGDAIPCNPDESKQKCAHDRYVYILSNAHVFTHSLPKFSAACTVAFWIRRDPAAALGIIFQYCAIIAVVSYLTIKIAIYITSKRIARNIKTYLHDYKVDLLKTAGDQDTRVPGFASVTIIQLRDLFMASYSYIIRRILWESILKDIRSDTRITITSAVDMTGRLAEFVTWNGLILSSSFGEDTQFVGRHFKSHVSTIQMPPPSEDHE